MRKLVALALLTLVTMPAQAKQPATEDAKAFLTRLYATYDHNGDGPQPTPAEAGTVFAPSLAAAYVQLIREEARQQDLLGPDIDPFCMCQDTPGATFAVSVAPRDKDTATGTVIIDFTQANPRPPATVVTLDLVHLNAGWRIANIHGEAIPDLLDAYRQPLKNKN